MLEEILENLKPTPQSDHQHMRSNRIRSSHEECMEVSGVTKRKLGSKRRGGKA